MSNFYTYTIELRDRLTSALRRAGRSVIESTRRVRDLRRGVRDLNNTSLNKLRSSFNNFFRSISPIVLLTGALYKVTQAIGASQKAYADASAQESKLATIMGNMMGARKEDVQSILKLASAQEKLGVVSADVITAGAQELATYLTKKSNLEKIIPVMNNMVAQQYGLNASQDQAVSIATMLGKVMDGQVGALSRYGYKFDSIQENILKTGTEAQRAAVLFEVVNSAVGNVNENLAKTPAGREKQRAMQIGMLSERLGKLIVSIKNAFGSLSSFFINIADRVLSFFEQNQTSVMTAISIILAVFMRVFKAIISAIRWAHGIYKTFIDGINKGNPVFIALAAAIAAITAGLIAYNLVVGAITLITNIWTAAQWLLNAALTANPVGLIIAGVVALIALIAFLIIKIDGWGETWDNVVKLCKLGFLSFKESVVLNWLKVQDAFLSGLAVIEKGWYKLQSLWNSEAANVGLAKLEAERNNRAQAIADQFGKTQDLAKQMADMDVIALKVNDTSLSDVVDRMKTSLGIAPAKVAGMYSDGNTNTGGGLGSGSGGGSDGRNTANSIATGGTKTTHITINLGNLVQTMNVTAGNVKEGAEKVRDIVLDELSRALTMAQANA